ncbi:hypothetical protein O6H91_Y495900 [Diphasiastrum complanatum]|nr:hypothetical protein O6H91_Y495900 [Diphasiastrum complanatum]
MGSVLQELKIYSMTVDGHPAGVLAGVGKVLAELEKTGAKWVQFDEPTPMLDLEAHKLDAFQKAYQSLGANSTGIKLLVETYFADIPTEAYK